MKRTSRALMLPIAAALLLGTATGRAQSSRDPDPWFGPDKALHFTLSAAITAGGYGLTSLVTPDLTTRVAFGAGLGIAAGAGKEILDLAGFGDPSWRDFAWDVIGTAVGVGLAVTFDLATRTPESAH